MRKLRIGQYVNYIDIFSDEMKRGIFRGVETIHQQRNGWTESTLYMIIDPLCEGENHEKQYDPDSEGIVRMSIEMYEVLMNSHAQKFRGARVFVKPRVSQDMLPPGIQIAQAGNRFG